jgi:hypothetical protein
MDSMKFPISRILFPVQTKEFPINPATGIGLHVFDLISCFRYQNSTYRAQSKKFPVIFRGVDPESATWEMGTVL